MSKLNSILRRHGIPDPIMDGQGNSERYLGYGKAQGWVRPDGETIIAGSLVTKLDPNDISRLDLRQGQPVLFAQGAGSIAQKVEIDFNRLDLGKTLEAIICRTHSEESSGELRIRRMYVGYENTDAQEGEYLRRDQRVTCRLVRTQDGGIKAVDVKIYLGIPSVVWYYNSKGAEYGKIHGRLITKDGNTVEVRELGLNMVRGQHVYFNPYSANLAYKYLLNNSMSTIRHGVYIGNGAVRSLFGNSIFSLEGEFDKHDFNVGDIIEFKYTTFGRGMRGQSEFEANRGKAPFKHTAAINHYSPEKREGRVGNIPFHARNIGDGTASWRSRKEFENCLREGVSVNFDTRRIDGKNQVYMGMTRL